VQFVALMISMTHLPVAAGSALCPGHPFFQVTTNGVEAGLNGWFVSALVFVEPMLKARMSNDYLSRPISCPLSSVTGGTVRAVILERLRGL
jgi:hypothetical protein